MMNWSEYEEEQIRDRRRTILPLTAWAIAIGVILGAVLYASKAFSEPIYKAANEGVTLTLYSEPCQLKEHVTNLPHRITWEEKGKIFEGCFGANPGGFLVAYFVGDKTVAIIPVDIFVKVTGA